MNHFNREKTPLFDTFEISEAGQIASAVVCERRVKFRKTPIMTEKTVSSKEAQETTETTVPGMLNTKV